MKPYIIKWRMETDGPNPKAAAIEALDCIINGTSRVFDVRVKGESNSVELDLCEGPQDAMPDASAKRASLAMLSALREALSALNTAPRFNVGKTTSYNIAGQLLRAISQAEKAGI